MTHDFRNHASREFHKATLAERLGRAIVIAEISGQRQNRRHHAQAVIWFSHGAPARNARVLSTCKHQGRMRRDAKQRTVIAARIETAHIKVPMIVREEHQVTLNQTTLTAMKLAQLLFVW